MRERNANGEIGDQAQQSDETETAPDFLDRVFTETNHIGPIDHLKFLRVGVRQSAIRRERQSDEGIH
jgi:hypothetical protein